MNVLLVVFDFDGVMSDNRVQVHPSGGEAVCCHRGDGWGIARLKEAGFEVVVLSTETNPVVTARCRTSPHNVYADVAVSDLLTAMNQNVTAALVQHRRVAHA